MTRPFARVLRGDAPPACCIRCRRDNDLIDVGAEQVRDYGVVYLCTVCVAELIDGLGYVPRSDIATATADLEEQVKALKAAKPASEYIIPEKDTPDAVIDNLRDLLRDSFPGLDLRVLGVGQVDADGIPPVGSALAGGDRRDDLGDLGGDAGSAGTDDGDAGKDAGSPGRADQGLDILALDAEPDLAATERSSRRPRGRKGADGVQPAPTD